MINRTWGPYGRPCMDCEGPNDPYMIQFNLWNQITIPGERRQFLCLGCVEKRLGRQLVFEDFIDAPINFGVFGFHCIKFLEGRNEKQIQS